MMYVTEHQVCFGKMDSNLLLDFIPLHEISLVALSKENRVGMLNNLSKSFKNGIARSPTIIQGSSKDFPVTTQFGTRGRTASIPSNPADGDGPRTGAGFIIKTQREGHNAGRTYQIRVQTIEHAEEVVKQLNKSVDDALSSPGDWHLIKLQRKAKVFYESDACQMFVALLIVSAFLSSIVRSHNQYVTWNVRV